MGCPDFPIVLPQRRRRDRREARKRIPIFPHGGIAYRKTSTISRASPLRQFDAGRAKGVTEKPLKILRFQSAARDSCARSVEPAHD
jgi:hypothetical protein